MISVTQDKLVVKKYEYHMQYEQYYNFDAAWMATQIKTQNECKQVW